MAVSFRRRQAREAPGANYSKLQFFLPLILRLLPPTIPDRLLELNIVMGLLDRFRAQPRWKNASPVVRIAAVEELPLDQQDTLISIAREDRDAGVRMAALRKVVDPATLAAIGKADADARVREEVESLLVDLASGAFEGTDQAESLAALAGLSEARQLVTVARAAANEAVARAALDRLGDDASLAAVARKASLSAIRLEALSRVGADGEVASVALRSDHKDVAVAAVERLSARAVLDQVAERAKNKSAAKRARVLVRAMEAEAEAAAKARAEVVDAAKEAAREKTRAAETLCRRAEALVASDSDEGEALLAEIERDWRALGEVDAAHAARFGAAQTAAREAVSAHQAERVERARLRQAAAEAVAAHRAVCEQVDAAAGDEIPRQIEEARAAWAALPALGDATEQHRWTARFEEGCRAALKRHEAIGRQQAAREKALEVCEEAERLATTGTFPQARPEVQALRRAWHDLQSAGLDDEDLTARFAAVDAKLRDREAVSREERARLLADNHVRLQALCAELEALSATQGLSLKQAERAVRDARAAIDDAAPLPTRQDRDAADARLKAVLSTLFPRVQELREMDEWQKWANAGVQEELCQRVEQLLQVDDLAAAARQLRELQAQWKNVAAAPKGRSQALWNRFKAASDGVRTRCDAYFVKLAEDQASNAARKETLCQQAETLAASTDWIKTAEAIKALQAEWKTVGPSARAQEKALWDRFHAACDGFFTRRRDDLQRRKQEWAGNLARKDAICERAEAIARTTEWQAGIEEIKRLQAEWKTIGPVRKARADEVWRRFRTACDSFFEAYQQRHHAAASSAIAEAEQMCAQIEAWLPAADAADATPPEGVGETILELRRRIGEKLTGLPRDRALVLSDRFQHALSRLIETWPAAFVGTDLDPAGNASRMEALCVQVESLLGVGQDAGVVQVPSEEESPSSLLARQLREALATNTIAGRPDDAAKWKAIGEQVRAAQAAWKRIGPVPEASLRTLTARFQRACGRVNEKLDQSRRGPAAR